MRQGSRSVIEQLKTWGPPPWRATTQQQPAAVSLADAQKYCNSFTRNRYENFTVVSLLTPRKLRQDLANIYTFCRWADDLADEVGSPESSIMLLDWWEKQLDDLLSASQNSKVDPRHRELHPAFVALGDTLSRHPVPPECFKDLLSAFRTDQTKNRYENDAELRDYCRKSANPVGRILLSLTHAANPTNLAWSDSVCTGLQIANFCQDVAVDASKDRIYLPESRWIENDLTEQQILASMDSPMLRNALQDWAAMAQQHLLSGIELVRTTPLWLARSLQLIIRGGLSILQKIRARSFDVWSRPIEVSKRQKLIIFARALALPRSRSFSFVPIPETKNTGLHQEKMRANQ